MLQGPDFGLGDFYLRRFDSVAQINASSLRRHCENVLMSAGIFGELHLNFNTCASFSLANKSALI